MSSLNLSAYEKSQLPDAGSFRIGIVVSEWNADITDNLLRGTREVLTELNIRLDNLTVLYVPGSFELPFGAQMLLENKSVEAVICLGCVVRGETAHFDFVSSSCANGIREVGLKYNKPVIFGVLTDNTIEQSRARSGGTLGNKGAEAAVTAVKMIALKRQIEDSWV